MKMALLATAVSVSVVLNSRRPACVRIGMIRPSVLMRVGSRWWPDWSGVLPVVVTRQQVYRVASYVAVVPPSDLGVWDLVQVRVGPFGLEWLKFIAKPAEYVGHGGIITV